MISISLCMIIKNEEKVIARCLESVKTFADEIILIDTGSTDQTLDIIKKYTNQIYHYKWVDHFAEARNYSFSKATKDYIFWMDADDFILPGDLEKLQHLKKNLTPDIDSCLLYTSPSPRD